MANKFLLLFVMCFFALITTNLNAQLCNDIPIDLVDAQFEFTASDIESFGDSMIVFNLTNNHATDYFAYPQAKFEMLSPLPAGMSLNSINANWAVFASAWIVGETRPVHIYYDIASPISVDYTITFRLWLNNLIPVIDSCFFDAIYSLNLNPSGTEITTQPAVDQFFAYPNPINGSSLLTLMTAEQQIVGQYTITNILGEVIQSGNYSNTGIMLEHLSIGLYTIRLIDHQQIKGIVTFVVQ